MSILLLSKTSEWCRAAQRFVASVAPDSIIVEGERTDPIPNDLRSWSGEYLVSFLGPWVVPRDVLARTSRAAINFHPGPPEYPGIGCYNFALYEGAAEYGVTCHHMAALVDSGPIVRVVRFPIFPSDTVSSLKERSAAHLLSLFYDIVSGIVSGAQLATSDERWTRRPFTRRELDDLCRIEAGMDSAEVERRLRATTYPDTSGPFAAAAVSSRAR